MIKTRIPALIRVTYEKFGEIIRFSLVGIVNTVVDLTIFIFVFNILGLQSYISHAISYSCGVVNSFVLNKSWTFKADKGCGIHRFARFFILSLISLGLSTAIIYISSNILNLNDYIAKFVATVFSMLTNYLGSRRYVFNSTKTQY